MQPARVIAGLVLMGMPIAAVTLLTELKPVSVTEPEGTTDTVSSAQTQLELEHVSDIGAFEGGDSALPDVQFSPGESAGINDQPMTEPTAKVTSKADVSITTADEFNTNLLENPYTPYSQLGDEVDALKEETVLREDWLAHLLDNPNAIPPQTDYLLSRLPASDIEPFLSGALNSDDAILQRVALTTMRMHPNTSLSDAGLEPSVYSIIQGDFEVSTRREAINVLGEHGAKEAELKTDQNLKNNLVLALRDESATVRHAAITAMAKVYEDDSTQQQEVYNAILKELRHTDASVRESATFKLDVWLDHLDATDSLSSAVVGHLAMSPVDEQEEGHDRRLREVKTILSYLPLSAAQKNELSVMGYL